MQSHLGWLRRRRAGSRSRHRSRHWLISGGGGAGSHLPLERFDPSDEALDNFLKIRDGWFGCLSKCRRSRHQNRAEAEHSRPAPAASQRRLHTSRFH
jgi:hypothetical protein